MALRDLLFRCPECGHRPLSGRGDRASCEGCSRNYLRGGPGASILVVDPDGTQRWASARGLLAAVLADEGRSWGASGVDVGSSEGAYRRVEPRERNDGRERIEKRIEERAEVHVRRSVAEEPLWHGGRLHGFVERLGRPRRSILCLREDGLEIRGCDATEGIQCRWNLMDLRAIQASSSALQVYTAADELVHFRFTEDSSLRWEFLLQSVLERAYRERDLGEIVEFQPRIVTR